jgi:hypothetical protein
MGSGPVGQKIHKVGQKIHKVGQKIHKVGQKIHQVGQKIHQWAKRSTKWAKRSTKWAKRINWTYLVCNSRYWCKLQIKFRWVSCLDAHRSNVEPNLQQTSY